MDYSNYNTEELKTKLNPLDQKEIIKNLNFNSLKLKFNLVHPPADIDKYHD